MASFKYNVFTLTTLAASAYARLNIHNYCGVDVTVVQSHAAGCDFGPNGCTDQGNQPWVIGRDGILNLDWIADGIGTSVKIGKTGVAGVLQYEYTMATGDFGGLYWDLSDLDGSGAGLVGTPFRSDNVKVTPTGNGEGQGSCVKIRCRANSVCLDSYQHPDDPNTKWCPTDTGDMWLDLCQPDDIFETRSLANESAENPHIHRHKSRHLASHIHGHSKRHN
jgi:hypothetical protein